MSAEIGQVLRAARDERGVGLWEVERATKIRRRYLEAIEEERWEELPGRAYASGFLRTYAEHLGVDPAPLVERLHQALGPLAGEEGPPEPVVQPGTLPSGLRRRLSVGLAALIVAIAAAAGIMAWALVTGDNEDEALAPTPPAEVEEEGEEPPPAEEGEEPEPEPGRPEQVRLRLEAIGDVWVCVLDGRGEALVDAEILAAGEQRGPFEARRFEMTFGNGQVDLRADGEQVDVEPSPSPLGYAVTAAGAQELGPAQRPTCA